MIYEWFNIFKLQDFLDMGIPSHEFELNLEGRGKKRFLITKGEVVGITCGDVFIPMVFDNNPQYFEDMALSIINGDLIWGFLIED